MPCGLYPTRQYNQCKLWVLADAIVFDLKDVYGKEADYSVIYPYIYEVEANIEDVWNIKKDQEWVADYFQATKAVVIREISHLEKLKI